VYGYYADDHTGGYKLAGTATVNVTVPPPFFCPQFVLIGGGRSSLALVLLSLTTTLQAQVTAWVEGNTIWVTVSGTDPQSRQCCIGADESLRITSTCSGTT
jgi:hypothetical protein